MMTESDIRKLLAKAAPVDFRQAHLDHLHKHIDPQFKDFNKRVFEELAREPVELYDIDEIAGPRLVATVYGWQEPRGSYSEDYRADAKSVQPTQGVRQDAEAMTYRDGVWRVVDHKYGLLTPDREATIKAQVDAFLSRGGSYEA